MVEVDERAAVSAYIKERLTEEQREKGRGYQADVARATKLSTSFIANLINHPEKGVGFDAAPSFAAFWGMSLTELLTAALDRAKLKPPVAAVPRYPNLAAAIEFLRSREAVPDEVVDEARGLAKHMRDFDIATWFVLLGVLIQDHRAHRLSGSGPRAARKV